MKPKLLCILFRARKDSKEILRTTSNFPRVQTAPSRNSDDGKSNSAFEGIESVGDALSDETSAVISCDSWK